MRTLRRTVAVAALFVAAAGAVLVAPQAAQAQTVSHRCKNQGAVVNNIRAGLCATMDLGAGNVLGFSEAFCQLASSPFSIRKCAGIEVGTDLYRRTYNGSWVMVVHSVNLACGTKLPSYPCPSADRFTMTSGGYGYGGPTCYFFKVGARATIVLPGGTSVAGIRIDSGEWANPACSA